VALLSLAKVTVKPASAAFTCARVPWNCRMSLAPERVTAHRPPLWLVWPKLTPPPAKPVA